MIDRKGHTNQQLEWNQKLWWVRQEALEVLLQLKGGKWKGFFHVPRFLHKGWKTIDAIIEKQNK